VFKDPRVHFAINCAAKSCPPLRSEPYRGSELDQQLDEMTRAFINDLESNRLEDFTLYVSSIFKWFAEDFNKDVIGFFLKYAQGNLKEQLEAHKEKIKVTYLDYDWSLNGK
jgi:transcriptional antiterminator